MMRSPPPPTTQQQQSAQSSYGNPYQAQAPSSSASIHPAYGGFLNDPTAQMGFQVGKSAVMAGQDYVEQNVRRDKLLSGLERLLTWRSPGSVQSVHQCVGAEALLQCLQQLRSV